MPQSIGALVGVDAEVGELEVAMAGAKVAGDEVAIGSRPFH
jgi:hypothetical protein